MSDKEGSAGPTPSGDGSQGGQGNLDSDDQSPSTSTRNVQGPHEGSQAPRPHELIPAHIKDKEKIEVRRLLMKTAAKELGSIRQTLQGDALSSEVLCAKFMKRKALYCCTADPDKPDRRPVRPLDILCEAKVSAASPAFIKCSCEACTGGTSGYTGGSFRSVGEFLQHGKEVFGPNTIVVMAELELSWPELLDLLRLDPCDHMWYCLFCEEDLPGAPLRTCDACQLACHGACYTRTYGQPLAAGPDGRVLCLSCQDPSLQTLQEIQAPKATSSKAGTARYTVPLMHNEVFRRETNPSHFEKGTYDFWGPKQARLMDALVLPMDSPEAQAGLAAASAAGFGAAAAGEGDGSDTAAAADKPEAAAAAAAAAAVSTGEQQQDKANEAADNASAKHTEDQQEARKKATHVLLVRDPSGQVLTIDYEFGKYHKTHGENRKLWVIPLLEHLQMQLGDLLIATREPLSSSRQQQKRQQQQPEWQTTLDKCDKVLQLHIIRKGKEKSQQQPGTATSRAQAALKAAAEKAAAAAAGRAAAAATSAKPSAAAAGADAAAAAAESTPAAAAAAAGRRSSRITSDNPTGSRAGQSSDTSDYDDDPEPASDDGQALLPGGTPAPTVVQKAPPGLSLFNAVATTKPGHGRRGAAAAFSAAAEAIANEAMTKPAYEVVQQRRAEQQAYLRQLEEQHRQQEQLRLQQQLLQQQLLEKMEAEATGAGPLPGAPDSDEEVSDAEEQQPFERDPGETGDDDYKAPAHLTRGRGRGRGRPRGSGRGRGSVRGRGRAHTKFAVEGSDADLEFEEGAEGQQQKAKRKRRTRAEIMADAELAAAAAVEASDGAVLSGNEQQKVKRQRKQASSSSAAAAEEQKLHQQQGEGKAGAGAAAAAGSGAASDAACGLQVEQLQVQLAEAQQQIASLQRQLDTAAHQRATLEKARFEAIKQRDDAVAARDKSQAQCRLAQRECEQLKAQLQELRSEAAAGGENAI